MSYKRILFSIGTIAIVAAVSAGVTGAFFTDTAESQGNTFNSGTLDLLINPDEASTGGFVSTATESQTPGYGNLSPGGDEANLSTQLRNDGSSDAAGIGLGVDHTTNQNGIASQMRITQLDWEGQSLLEGGAGATIGEYVAPTPANCDVTVSGGSGFATAISNATAGEVICVDSGTYSTGGATVAVDDVIVLGLNDPASGDKATVDGELLVTSDGVSIRGLEMTNPDGRSVVRSSNASNLLITENVIENVGTDDTVVNTGGVQAVYVEGGGENVFNISYNRFTGIGNTALTGSSPNGSSAKAIYFGNTGSSGGVDDVTIEHNEISLVRTSAGTGGKGAYGFLTNHDDGITNLSIQNNSISDLVGRWAQGVSLYNDTPNAEVILNDFSNIPNETAINIEDNAGAASITIEENNFNESVAEGVLNQTGSAVTAQNNWWGGFTTTEDNAGSGSIDVSNLAGGPFVGLINGNDYNGNGFADLGELAANPIENATPGLDAGDTGDLEFFVQLDGPTTGNGFQGSDLKSDFTFTLGQVAN